MIGTHLARGSAAPGQAAQRRLEPTIGQGRTIEPRLGLRLPVLPARQQQQGDPRGATPLPSRSSRQRRIHLAGGGGSSRPSHARGDTQAGRGAWDQARRDQASRKPNKAKVARDQTDAGEPDGRLEVKLGPERINETVRGGARSCCAMKCSCGVRCRWCWGVSRRRSEARARSP